MNWLTILLVYVLNIRSDENLYKIQKAYFLKNDFLCFDQDQIKIYKGYFYKLGIDVRFKSGYILESYYHTESCYILKSTNCGYIVPRNLMLKGIITVLNSPEDYNFFLRLRFFFSDKPIISRDNRIYEKISQKYVTYKSLKKNSKNHNNIIFESDGIDIRIEHIKDMFEYFILMYPLKFKEYIKFFEDKKISKVECDAKFDLYYLKDYSECLKNLESFINALSCFRLLDDGLLDSLNTKFSNMFINNKMITILQVSQFEERLYKKIYENVKNRNDIEIDETWKIIINEYYNYIKNEMLNNNLFFPIGGKYDINYFIEQLSNLIYESLKRIQRDCGVRPSEGKSFVFSEVDYYLLKSDLKRIQLSALKDLCESEYVHKHFSKFIEKKVETLNDYINIEKIICDHYNMFVYIVNLYHKFHKKSCDSYSYISPIFIDDYNLEIIEGIKIEFKRPSESIKIKMFNDIGKEITMLKDKDYFIIDFRIFYFPSDVLKMKNIQTFEIILSYFERNNKRLKISEYLSA